ncbi:MAG: hypothetical protein H8E47_03120 [Anaerolineales bacterium]|nr:hypothetical protein [Anaerolineales bacterium]
MLSSFDWLRRSETGAELLATLEYLTSRPDLFPSGDEIGPPFSALNGPCPRCWVYPRAPSSRRNYCPSCHAIAARASRLGGISRQSIVLWGLVNRLSKLLQMGEGFDDYHVLGAYAHDENHFLLMMPRHELKPWLQELVIYHGADLKGLIQILPTTGVGKGVNMGDVLCRAVYHEARFPMDQLRVRFFSAPHQILIPHARDKQGLLTFEVSEFLSVLEMAAVFRTILRPQEQASLYELLNLEDTSEEQFYWGRFLGFLTQEAKDMLSAWRIRQWPKDRIKLLYELVNYVAFYQTY